MHLQGYGCVDSFVVFLPEFNATSLLTHVILLPRQLGQLGKHLFACEIVQFYLCRFKHAGCRVDWPN